MEAPGPPPELQAAPPVLEVRGRCPCFPSCYCAITLYSLPFPSFVQVACMRACTGAPPLPSAPSLCLPTFPTAAAAVRLPPSLQAYVHARIQHFNTQPALQQRLGPEAAAALQTATVELLGFAAAGGGVDGLQAQAAAAAVRPPELALVFKHDCLHLGCADLHCKL